MTFVLAVKTKNNTLYLPDPAKQYTSVFTLSKRGALKFNTELEAKLILQEHRVMTSGKTRLKIMQIEDIE